MENKSNGGLIAIIIILVIALLGLSFYMAYDKGLIFNNQNDVEENGNADDVEAKEEDNLVEQLVPTDMSLVSTKLDEFGLNRYVMHEYSDWNNGNLLNDSSNKLDLLNAYFMENNLVTSGCDDQCAVISLETYKAKYVEVYGSLDNFEYDTANASSYVFSISDSYWDVPAEYVHWNQVWGLLPYNITLEATSVTYDENNQNYVIDGNMMATQWDNNTETNVSIGSKGTFKITYVNDGTKTYITGITIFSTEN